MGKIIYLFVCFSLIFGCATIDKPIFSKLILDDQGFSADPFWIAELGSTAEQIKMLGDSNSFLGVNGEVIYSYHQEFGILISKEFEVTFQNEPSKANIALDTIEGYFESKTNSIGNIIVPFSDMGVGGRKVYEYKDITYEFMVISASLGSSNFISITIVGTTDLDKINKGNLNEDEVVLAEYDGGKITLFDIYLKIDKIPSGYQTRYSTPEGKENLLNLICTEELFYLEALNLGLDKDKQVLNKISIKMNEKDNNYSLEEIRKSIILRAIYDKKVKSEMTKEQSKIIFDEITIELEKKYNLIKYPNRL